MTCALVAAACGENGPPMMPADADTSAETLAILDPPGESIGLAFAASAELRVRYSGAHGSPVAFALVADGARGEAPGGSSLGAEQALTDDQGVARVSLVAGAVRTHFRVEVSAPRASVATFYVTVSDEGFTQLLVTPRHVGERPDGEFDVVELRLYGAHTCATLDATDPPPSAYPPRSMDRFDEPATFSALGSNQAYSVLSWGRNAAGHVLAEGCVDLTPAQVRPGQTLRLDLAVIDLALTLGASYVVSSSFDLAPVVEAVLVGSMGWRIASCPLGTAQLVLDCAIDAMDPVDPDDCVIESPGDPARAIELTRGVLDADGCRGPLGEGGGASAEATLTAMLPLELAPIASALTALLGHLSLSSRLVVQASGGSADHRLGRATLGVGTTSHEADLASTPRPVVAALSPLSGAGSIRTLAEHGFTFWLGDLAGAGMSAEILTPMMIDPDPYALGSTIVFGASVAGSTGCAAVSKVICSDAALAEGCLEGACTESLATLDGALASPMTRLWWPGIDFRLSGDAVLADTDGDLVADTLGGGIWQATIVLSDGTELTVWGTFAGTIE